MTSFKNLLQEYCHKNKLNLPKYDTFRIDQNKDNTPFFMSELRLFDQIFKNTSNTKKTAEMKVAESALEYINSIDLSFQIKEKNIRKQKVNHLDDIQFDNDIKVLLVDGENADINISIFDETLIVLIFVAKNTTKNVVFEMQAKYKNYYVFISESVGKDAADHLLTFYAGMLEIINKDKLIHYYVLTKDHYGEFLEKFMKNCKFICSTDEMI